MTALAASGWRLPDDACALLRRLVLAERPGLVVEAGSGRSTVVIAAALAEVGAGRLVSLEHHRAYADETWAMLTEAGVDEWAKVRVAPLEPHGLDLACPSWYAAAAWNDLEGIGMLLVDGPPGGSHRFARWPAVPLLASRLARGCLVVLDDVARADEAAALAAWRLRGVRRFGHAKATLAYGRAPARSRERVSA